MYIIIMYLKSIPNSLVMKISFEMKEQNIAPILPILCVHSVVATPCRMFDVQNGGTGKTGHYGVS